MEVRPVPHSYNLNTNMCTLQHIVPFPACRHRISSGAQGHMHMSVCGTSWQQLRKHQSIKAEKDTKGNIKGEEGIIRDGKSLLKELCSNRHQKPEELQILWATGWKWSKNIKIQEVKYLIYNNKFRLSMCRSWSWKREKNRTGMNKRVFISQKVLKADNRHNFKASLFSIKPNTTSLIMWRIDYCSLHLQ